MTIQEKARQAAQEVVNRAGGFTTEDVADAVAVAVLLEARNQCEDAEDFGRIQGLLAQFSGDQPRPETETAPERVECDQCGLKQSEWELPLVVGASCPRHYLDDDSCDGVIRVLPSSVAPPAQEPETPDPWTYFSGNRSAPAAPSPSGEPICGPLDSGDICPHPLGHTGAHVSMEPPSPSDVEQARRRYLDAVDALNTARLDFDLSSPLRLRAEDAWQQVLAAVRQEQAAEIERLKTQSDAWMDRVEQLDAKIERMKGALGLTQDALITARERAERAEAALKEMTEDRNLSDDLLARIQGIVDGSGSTGSYQHHLDALIRQKLAALSVPPSDVLERPEIVQAKQRVWNLVAEWSELSGKNAQLKWLEADDAFDAFGALVFQHTARPAQEKKNDSGAGLIGQVAADMAGTEPRPNIRDRVLAAGVGWCAFTHSHDNSKAALKAGREALLVAFDRLILKTTAADCSLLQPCRRETCRCSQPLDLGRPVDVLRSLIEELSEVVP